MDKPKIASINFCENGNVIVWAEDGTQLTEFAFGNIYTERLERIRQASGCDLTGLDISVPQFGRLCPIQPINDRKSGKIINIKFSQP